MRQTAPFSEHRLCPPVNPSRCHPSESNYFRLFVCTPNTRRTLLAVSQHSTVLQQVTVKQDRDSAVIIIRVTHSRKITASGPLPSDRRTAVLDHSTFACSATVHCCSAHSPPGGQLPVVLNDSFGMRWKKQFYYCRGCGPAA